ncbi:MAG: GNAT family N-acetyltransferase [Pseudomonadota bacterium]
MFIRHFDDEDWPAVWSILAPVFRAGETYRFAPDMSATEARRVWLEVPAATFVAVDSAGTILGTYFIKANQPGLGDHVCNCGYVVSAAARGQGVASTMCEHSQQTAIAMGFKAMQYNFVVASNLGAIRLWQKLGFDIVGTLPGAFRHAALGDVDAHIMYKVLQP